MRVLDTKTIDVAIKDIDYEMKLDGVDDPVMWLKLKDALTDRLNYLHERKQIKIKSEMKR